MAPRRIYSVGQVNSYINTLFSSDYLLKHIFVRGEVSGCKYHTSGHIYFTLKDETGTLAAVMFAGQRAGLSFRLEQGQKVIVEGSVSVYERDGKYQLYARSIVADGAGDLHLRFEQLKKDLADMGMFDESFKRPIPQYVTTVGVVTAPTGAAIRDIVNITSRRNPFVQLILAPALVQGEGAAASIARAIGRLDALRPDVMIVGRGGGSIEDLWAFNEEIVARAIFDCDTPVISAVGHETDFTIADFVADLRAPTPSAAAELAVFDIHDFYERTDGLRRRLAMDLSGRLAESRLRLGKLSRRLEAGSPSRRLEQQARELAELSRAMADRMRQSIEDSRDFLADSAAGMRAATAMKLEGARRQLAVNAARLDGVSPLKKLAQGYAFVTDSAGRNVKSAAAVRPGDAVNIRVSDGEIEADVRGTCPAGPYNRNRRDDEDG